MTICDRCRREIAVAGDVPFPGVADLDVQTLPSVPAAEYLHLPSTGGVYFAMVPRGICYIGSAENFFLRWRHHRQLERLLIEPDAVIAWLEIPDKTARFTYELASIHRFKPLWNVRGAERLTGSEFARMRHAIRTELKRRGHAAVKHISNYGFRERG